MANIVNLNRARKKKKSADKDHQAELNRAKFGRTKTEKDRTKAEEAMRESTLDAHKRDGVEQCE